MVVIPDAVLLDGIAEWKGVSQQVLMHCGELQSRVAILDVYHGDQERTHDANDVVTAFRGEMTSDYLSYGMAYYPWVDTNIVGTTDVDFTLIKEKTSRKALMAEVKKQIKEERKIGLSKKQIEKLDSEFDDDFTAEFGEFETTIGEEEVPLTKDRIQAVNRAHQALMGASQYYRSTMEGIKGQLNLLPPSAGMAGVFTRVDNTLGVFKAPANTTMNSVNSPKVNISHDEQQDLNVPINGKAINAIRSFIGRGVLVWGARTLDGNSQDWRYISVRRTLIMLEQSIKFAAEAYVFAPNNASTWVTVSNMIGNFLNNKWKEGALVGATPSEAYSVDIGLGSTMTGNDILDGYMRITIKVAVVRPAEFIVITFQQKMQTS
jgi:hypothetical protein